MKFLSRLFGRRREMNLTTALERQRLGRTMPGQSGAVAASRLGGLVPGIDSRLPALPRRTLAASPPHGHDGRRRFFFLDITCRKSLPICGPCRKFNGVCGENGPIDNPVLS